MQNQAEMMQQAPVDQAVPQPDVPPALEVLQQAIERIIEASKAPPLSPPEYRTLFELIALEITENNLTGTQTVQNIVQRAVRIVQGNIKRRAADQCSQPRHGLSIAACLIQLGQQSW